MSTEVFKQVYVLSYLPMKTLTPVIIRNISYKHNKNRKIHKKNKISIKI